MCPIYVTIQFAIGIIVAMLRMCWSADARHDFTGTVHIHLTRIIFRTCYYSDPHAHEISRAIYSRHVCNLPICLTLMPACDCYIIKYRVPITSFFNLIFHSISAIIVKCYYYECQYVILILRFTCRIL